MLRDMDVDEKDLVDADIPLDSPLRTFRKRDLPDFLSSTYPYGQLSGQPRSRPQQSTFNIRKASILENMDAAQIETAYQATVSKVLAVLEQNRRENEEIDRKVESLKKSRETEVKVFHQMMEQRKKPDKQEDDPMDKSDGIVVKKEAG